MHASFDHGGRVGEEGAVVIREYLRLVMKDPRLTSEDLRIEGIVVFSLLHTVLYK